MLLFSTIRYFLLSLCCHGSFLARRDWRTLLVLAPKTSRLSGFPAFFFHLSSVICIRPWISIQGNACSILLWRVRVQSPQGSKVPYDFFYLHPQGMSYQDAVFSHLSFLFQLFPKYIFPLTTCLAWHHMLNESELSHLNAANTKIVLSISDALFTFPCCWFVKVGSTNITLNM